MSPARASWKTRFVLAADLVFSLLVGVAGLIEVQGGVKWHVGGLSLTAKSGYRAFLLAALLFTARHIVVPRPWLGRRVICALRRLLARGVLGTHLSTLLDSALVSLALLAIFADLTGEPSPGGASIELPSGAHLALAMIALLLVRQTVLRRGPSLAQQLRARWSTSQLQCQAPPARTCLGALLLFCGATAFMLRQQLMAYTNMPDLGDPLFSMWRLAWVAHQLPLDPRHLFDANIFHPAARTLAYSDAMLLPAFMAAPALWLGLPLAAVYTSLLLFSYVAAGVSMFVLVEGVTRHAGAALMAGLVFAFDTFRFLHYSHLELQFTFCMPLALFFVLRTLVTGSRRDGTLAGVFVALQGLCSLYYGLYFGVSLVVFVVAWIYFVKRVDTRALASLGLAAAIAAAVGLPVTLPYWATRTTVGERGADEVRGYSATGHDYVTAYRQSAVYGTRLWDSNNGERKLFPGTLPVVLGAAALWPPAAPLVAPAAAALAVSVDASLGLHGTIYTVLFDSFPPFRGFRAPARFRAVAGLYLALLTGVGIAALARRIDRVWATRAVLSVLGVLLLVDVHPALELQPLWNHAPGIYQLIPDRRAVLADLPLPWDGDPFWHDPVYMYFSTFHWHPIVNGSSGFMPPWYDQLGAISRDFPADQALDAFRRLGTEYFVLHEGYYRTQAFRRVVSDIEAQPRLQFVETATWEEGECRLYRLLR
jgi:hypothetical protein